MKNICDERKTFDELETAKQALAKLLPPQPDKIVRAFLNVERALHYADIDGGIDRSLDALRDALRALSRIDDRGSLPPPVAHATSVAMIRVVNGVHALETRRSRELLEAAIRPVGYNGPERRDDASMDKFSNCPRRRSDDTNDAWECLDEVLVAHADGATHGDVSTLNDIRPQATTPAASEAPD